MNEEDPNIIKKGSALILVHSKFGFVRAWAQDDYERVSGGLASFEVTVNSENMPGVHEMTINTNQWEVYKNDDPKLLKILIEKFVPPWIVR